MSVRDEMAEAMKKIKVFRPSPDDYADALMPIVERVAREVRENIVADIRGRRGLRQVWDGIDEEVQQEIESTHAEIVRRVVGAPSRE